MFSKHFIFINTQDTINQLFETFISLLIDGVKFLIWTQKYFSTPSQVQSAVSLNWVCQDHKLS